MEIDLMLAEIDIERQIKKTKESSVLNYVKNTKNNKYKKDHNVNKLKKMIAEYNYYMNGDIYGPE
jgi:hypothetical protein